MGDFFKYGSLVTLCISWLFSVDTVHAQGTYQSELSTSFFLSDDQGNDESKVYALSGRHHFSPVDPSGHPLKEAAFLERVGRFEFIFAMSDLRFAATGGADGPLYGGSVSYMQPGFPLLLSSGFARSDVAFDSPSETDLSVETYDLSFGYFLGRAFLVGFEYTHSETELSEPGVPNRLSEADDYAFVAKWLHRIDTETALNIEGAIELSRFEDALSTGSNVTFGILEEYYFNPRTSLGIGLALNRGDDKEDEGDTLTIIATAFVIPSFSIELKLEKFSAAELQGNNEDRFKLLLLSRF